MNKFKKQVIAFALLSLIGSFFVASSKALADDSLVSGQTGLAQIGTMAYGSSDTPADIRATVAKIINVVLMFLGVIFLALAVYAGFMYMTAAGNDEKTKEALTILRNAIIGLIILLMAWAITRFTVFILSRAVNNSVDYRTYYPSR